MKATRFSPLQAVPYLLPDNRVVTGIAGTPASKSSFLVYRRNKYMTVSTAQVAFFHVKHDVVMISTFGGQEYAINYSLDQVQQMMSTVQFFRLNRQYLINFDAVKEAEHYFARKLLVTPNIPFPEKLLVSKERAHEFLEWLENR